MDDEGTDVNALVQKGHISVTPLSLDATSSIDFSEIERLL
jgi:5'-nucleotidase